VECVRQFGQVEIEFSMFRVCWDVWISSESGCNINRSQLSRYKL
jgi:hypothetical protein